MNEHIQKALNAVDGAKAAEEKRDVSTYALLLSIAQMQAYLSIAISLDKIAEKYCNAGKQAGGYI